MLEAIARFAPPQPNEAMARMAPRLMPHPNRKHKHFSGPQLDSFGVDSRFETARSSSAFHFYALAVPETWDRATSHHAVTGSKNCTFRVGAISSESPCSEASFVVNSEHHSGARFSVRLCMGLNINSFICTVAN
jgi:hypothetical protein